MHFYDQYSGYQSKCRAFFIFQLFTHKLDNSKLRILSILRTIRCGALALLVQRNKDCPNSDVIILGTRQKEGDPNSKFSNVRLISPALTAILYTEFTLSLLKDYTEIKYANIDKTKIISTVCSYLTNFGPYGPIAEADANGKM